MRHSRILSLALVLMVCMTAVFPSTSQAANGTQEAPRLLNLWFTWQLPEEKLSELAKWDIVVLDVDQQARYPDRVRRLRQLNPKIKILAYIDSSNLLTARLVEESNFPYYKLAHAIPESWFMHRGTSRVGFWPGSWMINITDQAPTDGQGRRWADFFPDFVMQEVWSTGMWDGIFLDDALDNATWFVGKGLDMNGDGQADADSAVDAAWKAGWQRMVKNLRSKLGNSALLMGNGSAAYASQVNGILFEDFPRYGWANGFRDYQNSLKQNISPAISAFNGNPNNVNNPQSWQTMRFALATALLGDGYYSYDYGNQDHGQTWWYDEYDMVLGKALGAPRQLPNNSTTIIDGVWWRDYERGAVVLNSTGKDATITLPGIFERLRGSQDAKTNSGRVENALAVPSKDGLILYRRTAFVATPSAPVTSAPASTAVSSAATVSAPAASTPRSSAFSNGDFVRVYRADGTQARAGFFAQQSGAAGGATVVIEDVDRDGKSDILTAAKGEIRLTYGNGKSKILRPFGTSYKGGLSLAAGNTDYDTPWELVTGNDAGEVRVIELDGAQRVAWRPYGPFRGSVLVAIGDVNGDGLREIVTGAGPGGGPHIRIFKTDGAVLRGGWFAFDSRDRGGVSVTVADTDGDGKAEIITGSGQGTVPRVRLYNVEAQVIREFALSSQPGSLGVHVSVSDIDGDARFEILASGIRPAP